MSRHASSKPTGTQMPTTKKRESSSRIQYKRNFLTQVIVRIDFASPITIPKSGLKTSSMRKIAENFPIPEQRIAATRHIAVSESGVNETVAEKREWHFFGKNREKKLVITDDALFIEYKTYSSFVRLKDDFAVALEAFYKQFPETSIKRLGLRYVDKIEVPDGPPFDWSPYFEPHLLATFTLADDPKTLSRVFNVVEFNYGDTHLRFQFGMPNPDYPAPIRQKQFILDYDAYCTLLLSRDELDRYLDQFHEKIKSSFEEVITDDLRKLMGTLGD